MSQSVMRNAKSYYVADLRTMFGVKFLIREKS